MVETLIFFYSWLSMTSLRDTIPNMGFSGMSTSCPTLHQRNLKPYKLHFLQCALDAGFIDPHVKISNFTVKINSVVVYIFARDHGEFSRS